MSNLVVTFSPSPQRRRTVPSVIAHYPKENVGDKDIHYEMPTFASVTCERQGPDRVRPKIIAHYPTERQDDRARHYEMPTVAEVVTEDDIIHQAV